MKIAGKEVEQLIKREESAFYNRYYMRNVVIDIKKTCFWKKVCMSGAAARTSKFSIKIEKRI